MGFQVDEKNLDRYNQGMAKVKTGVLIAGAAMAGMGYMFLKAAGDMEQNKIAFTTLLGSAEKASKLLGDIAKFAATTPFEQTELINYAKSMLGVGFSANEIIPVMTTLGNIAAGIGKEKLPNIVLAFNKMKSKGRASLEELWPIVEAGVPILDQLAADLKTNKDGVIAMASAGKLSFEQVYKSLQKVEQAKFANLMVKQSKSFLGMMSNVMDAVTMFAVGVGDELLPAAKEIVTAFLDWFAANQKWIGQGLAGIFLGISDAIKTVMNVMSALLSVFGSTIEGTDNIRSVTEKLIYGLLALQGIIWAVKIATAAWTVVQWALNGAMIANPIGLIVVGIIALVAYIAIAITYWDDFGAAMMIFLGPIGMVINALMTLRKHWDGIVEAFTYEGIGAGLKAIGNMLLDFVLTPLKQALQLASNIPGMGFLANVIGDTGGSSSGSKNTASNFSADNLFAPLGKPGMDSVAGKYSNNANSSNINDIKVNVQVAVPSGTSETQKAYIERIAKDSMDKAWQGILSHTAATNKPVEAV